MWLTSSSIGRKFVMAITGICLVLFVTFHCLMNSVALFWPAAYNAICQFLGANWYALVASAGLAALFILHIIYALWLTVQNRKARGTDRYAVNSRPPQVEWSSKNMLVLGIVVLAFLAIHLIQFWAKMQLQELRSHELASFPLVEGIPADPQYGTLFIQMAFSQWWTPVVYIIGFIALWFHMNHGFWSMFHTIGWDNNIWIERLKKISCWWTSIVVLLFIAQAVLFTVRANEKFYTTDEALQHQYIESLSKKAEPIINEFIENYSPAIQQAQYGNITPLQDFINARGDEFVNRLTPIAEAASAIPAAANNRMLSSAGEIVDEIDNIKARLLEMTPPPTEEEPAATLPAADETETTTETNN